MYTPRKKSNYNSPYAKPEQVQYPSQNEDYISFGMGGQVQSGNEKSGHKNNSKGFNWQRRGKVNFFNNAECNTPSGNNSPQKHWTTPRKNNGHHGQKFFQHNREKNEQQSKSYVHPSMTEDPWKELMQRIHAINNSKISVKSQNEQSPDPIDEAASVPSPK